MTRAKPRINPQNHHFYGLIGLSKTIPKWQVYGIGFTTFGPHGILSMALPCQVGRKAWWMASHAGGAVADPYECQSPGEGWGS